MPWDESHWQHLCALLQTSCPHQPLSVHTACHPRISLPCTRRHRTPCQGPFGPAHIQLNSWCSLKKEPSWPEHTHTPRYLSSANCLLMGLATQTTSKWAIICNSATDICTRLSSTSETIDDKHTSLPLHNSNLKYASCHRDWSSQMKAAIQVYMSLQLWNATKSQVWDLCSTTWSINKLKYK